MAIAAVNMSYLGQPGTTAAQGQIVNSGLGGPLAGALVGIGTAVLDGAATTFTLNWIDGVQKIFQRPTVVVGLLSATAAATINGVANQTVYSGVGSMTQFRVGQSLVTTGFSNAGNNATSVITAISTSTIQVTNSGGVAETNPQGSGLVNFGAVLPAISGSSGVSNFRALVSAANVADTAANTITALISAVSATGCTVTISATGSNLQTLSVLVPIYSVV